MKRQVSYCVGLLVLFGAYAAFPQKTMKEVVQDRIPAIAKIIDAATAPNDIPSDLDTLLNMAVAFSPEARKSRAELDAIQIRITRDVAAAHAQRQNSLENMLRVKKDLTENPHQAFVNWNHDFVRRLRNAEEELRALTGLTLNQYPSIDTLFVPMDSIRNIQTFRADRATKRTPEDFPEPGHLKSILDGEPMNLDFRDMDLRNVLDLVGNKYGIHINIDTHVATTPVRLNLKNANLRDLLLVLADQSGNLTFVARDYGLFATTRDRAIRISGATIPDDVPYIADIPSGPFRSGFATGAGSRGFGAGGGGFGRGFGGVRFAMHAPPRMPQPRPTYEDGTPESLRKILEGTIGTTFKDTNVMDIFDFISDTYEINITVDLAFTPPTIRQIDLKNLPMRSALLALTDKMGDACFVIREYGLFVTTRERAQTMAGVTIPDDVPYFAPTPPGQIQRGFGGGVGTGSFDGGGGGIGGSGGAIPPPQTPEN